MRAFVAAALMLVLTLPARAQAPITTVVVNFVAGGPSDLMARLLASELSAALGGPVVVKNSAGAAGTIGAAKSPGPGRWDHAAAVVRRRNGDPATFPHGPALQAERSRRSARSPTRPWW